MPILRGNWENLSISTTWDSLMFMWGEKLAETRPNGSTAYARRPEVQIPSAWHMWLLRRDSFYVNRSLVIGRSIRSWLLFLNQNLDDAIVQDVIIEERESVLSPWYGSTIAADTVLALVSSLLTERVPRHSSRSIVITSFVLRLSL